MFLIFFISFIPSGIFTFLTPGQANFKPVSFSKKLTFTWNTFLNLKSSNNPSPSGDNEGGASIKLSSTSFFSWLITKAVEKMPLGVGNTITLKKSMGILNDVSSTYFGSLSFNTGPVNTQMRLLFLIVAASLIIYVSNPFQMPLFNFSA